MYLRFDGDRPLGELTDKKHLSIAAVPRRSVFAKAGNPFMSGKAAHKSEETRPLPSDL